MTPKVFPAETVAYLWLLGLMIGTVSGLAIGLLAFAPQTAMTFVGSWILVISWVLIVGLTIRRIRRGMFP